MSTRADASAPTVSVPEPVTTPVSSRFAARPFNTTPEVKVTGPSSEPDKLTAAVFVASDLVTVPAKFTEVPNKSMTSVSEASNAKVPFVATVPETRAVGVFPFAAVPLASASRATVLTPVASTLKRNTAEVVYPLGKFKNGIEDATISPSNAPIEVEVLEKGTKSPTASVVAIANCGEPQSDGPVKRAERIAKPAADTEPDAPETVR